MEQECVAGVYRTLGMSAGARFSSEDVSLLYRKVFHLPSTSDDAHAAMKKVAGEDSSWSCVGENVLNVLLEMEKERIKKERLYWDLQLLNVTDQPVVIDVHCHLTRKHLDTSRCGPYSSDTGALSCTPGRDRSRTGQSGRWEALRGSVSCVRRLKKASRQCWMRLASEGVQSILPSPQQSPKLRVKGQAWGCVSLSDVLLLVDVKYDVMTHLLYAEMLQEHHTQGVWETLLPWQRHKEEEELEELAEEALESGDALRLAELPGTFRIYSVCVGESRQQCWSAVSLLYELHTSHQQERDKLTVLGERLDRESLRLVCLYIRLATLRAQREKLSYCALLAGRQSWETWPHVISQGRVEQAALWLRGDANELNEDLISGCPQQAVLQLLVQIQEQERIHLVRLMQDVTMEDLQRPECTLPPEEDSDQQSVLRNGCIKKLRQIHAGLQTQNESQTSQPQLQMQLQTRAQERSDPAAWSQQHLEDCALVLLTNLLELQDVQASVLLRGLVHKCAEHIEALQDESELRAQSNNNLLQLLMSDGSRTAGAAEVLADVSVQADDVTDEQEVCTDCGDVMEEMPYLEILCISDAPSKTNHSPTAEGSQEEEGGDETISPQTYEKQGSLITLAWSKPPKGDYDTEAADGSTQDCDESLVQPQEICSKTSGEMQDEELTPTLFQTSSSGHHEASETQCKTERQVTLERGSVDQPQNRESVTDCDQQTHGLETLQEMQPDLLNEHSRFEVSSETAQVNEDQADMEQCPIPAEPQLWDQRWPEPTLTDDQEHSQPTFTEMEAGWESTQGERERVREPVSAMERERTIRNLVDMQRRVEQRQHRDRQRQMLRVQERLMIIQNRKAEEDLLGLKHTDRLRHLTQDLPQEDKSQQKTVVRERLEQLRRERSYVLQSKRDRNTAGLKELLGPVTAHSEQAEDGD